MDRGCNCTTAPHAASIKSNPHGRLRLHTWTHAIRIRPMQHCQQATVRWCRSADDANRCADDDDIAPHPQAGDGGAWRPNVLLPGGASVVREAARWAYKGADSSMVERTAAVWQREGGRGERQVGTRVYFKPTTAFARPLPLLCALLGGSASGWWASTPASLHPVHLCSVPVDGPRRRGSAPWFTRPRPRPRIYAHACTPTPTPTPRNRPDKREDGCYGWWVGASLAILGHGSRGRDDHAADAVNGAEGEDQAIDRPKLMQFLISLQTDDGGLSPRRGDAADVYHTHFGVAALALLGHPATTAVDPVHCMPPATVARLRAFGRGKGCA